MVSASFKHDDYDDWRYIKLQKPHIEDFYTIHSPCIYVYLHAYII